MPSKGTTKSVEMMSGADNVQDKVQNTYEETAVKFQRKIDKSQIPTCKILGVDIAAIDMDWLLKFTEKNIEKLKGDFMCVVNVYCVKIAYKMGLRSICYAHMG